MHYPPPCPEPLVFGEGGADPLSVDRDVRPVGLAPATPVWYTVFQDAVTKDSERGESGFRRTHSLFEQKCLLIFGPVHRTGRIEGDAVNKKDIESRVREFGRPIVEGLGLKLVDVEMVKEGARRILRLIIYRSEGVTLDDCEAVSEALSLELDRHDLIEGPYSLEVSSPGLERVFRNPDEFEIFAGKRVSVSTYSPIEAAGGSRSIRGVLVGLREGVIAVDAGGTMIEVPQSAVARVRLDEVDEEFQKRRGGMRRER